MNKEKYGVAYLDKDGAGFSDKEPFIEDCISLNSCKERVEYLICDGYKTVVPFKYGKKMEFYDWDYINQHRLVF